MSSLRYLSQINPRRFNLPAAALSMAKIITFPRLNVQAYLDKLNLLADEAASALPLSSSDNQKAAALARFLFKDKGYRGNAHNYYDPNNSFLNEVIDRKLGIPISLSVIFIDIARRLELDAWGVGLPGHFIVSVNTDNSTTYLDPFHGGKILSQADCRRLVATIGGARRDFNPEWLEPVPDVAIIFRMLQNLRMIYIQNKDWVATLKVLELMSLTQPNVPSHIRDLGLVHHKYGNPMKAIYYLEAYLLRDFKAQDAGAIRSVLTRLVDEISKPN